VTDEDVYSHFAEVGQIEFVRIIRDNKTGIGKGFGYVQFKTPDSIQLALKLDGSEIKKRKIRCTRCVKKQVMFKIWVKFDFLDPIWNNST
jgi:nucleolar protein 12